MKVIKAILWGMLDFVAFVCGSIADQILGTNTANQKPPGKDQGFMDYALNGPPKEKTKRPTESNADNVPLDAYEDWFPFQRRDLFSNAEASLWHILKNIVGNDGHLLGKVRLADLVEVIPGSKRWQGHFNRINNKHIDFVIVDSNLRVAVCVELDDKSHQREDRQERDAFVDGTMEEAGIPLLRVRARRGYQPGDVEEALRHCMSERGVHSF